MSWREFWNRDNRIYVNDRHRALHDEAVAKGIAALIHAPEDVVLDYGCGDASEGVLVASVTDDSPASRAGLKAGDVIVSVNSQNISSRADLTRAVNGAGSNADITIGIVRDRKESSVKARLDEVSAQRPAPRRVRPVTWRQA